MNRTTRWLLLAALVQVACGSGSGAGGATSSTASAAGDPCADKPACKQVGACVEKRGAAAPAGRVVCVPTTEAHCRHAHVCTVFGACAYKDEACVVALDDDCRASKNCAAEGRCKAAPALNAYQCVATADDCKAAKVCTERGLCVAGKTGYCEPENDEACEKAPDCKAKGACHVGRESGQRVCQPTSDDDCKQSEACEKSRACKLVEGLCSTG